MLIQNARVLVIDDIYDEVKRLLWTLNKNGLAFNYYKGDDHRELPHKPLKRVRFLFLDFVLGTDGQSDDNKIAALMNVIRKTVSVDNGPYIILAWTKHDTPQDNLFDLFKDKMIKSQGMPIPMAIINLEKRDCMNSLARIERNIRQKINDKQILEILLHWEAHAGSATGKVLKTLSDISKPEIKPGQSFDDYSSAWNAELERHIYWIAESSLGQNTRADRDMLIAAQISFTELFRDHIESVIKNETKPFRTLVRKIGLHKNRKYSANEKAHMNTSFLLISKDVDNKLQPGNIYKFDDVFERIKCERKDCYYNKIKLSRQQIVKEFFEGDLGKYPKNISLVKKAIPVLMEITPECDYAQRKWKNAKMVMGVLWPETLEGESSLNKKIKPKTGYISVPFSVKYKGEIYYLTFNAHHLFNVSFNIFNSVTPILKARKDLLVDIQHWFSGHISRPGKTEF